MAGPLRGWNQQQYKPRNENPLAVVGACLFFAEDTNVVWVWLTFLCSNLIFFAAIKTQTDFFQNMHVRMNGEWKEQTLTTNSHPYLWLEQDDKEPSLKVNHMFKIPVFNLKLVTHDKPFSLCSLWSRTQSEEAKRSTEIFCCYVPFSGLLAS